MLNIPHKFKDKSDWLQFKGKSIGGSTISAILGLNKYRSPYDVWLELTGRQEPPAQNNHMTAGVFLENGVAEWFEYETGHHVVKASADNIIMEHPKYPFIKASPDRKVFLNGSRKHEDTAIMEIKTTGRAIDPDEIPLEWYIQPTLYAGSWEFPKIIICWYDRHRNNIDYKIYDFDKELFDMLIEQAVNFWNTYVLTDTPPPAQSESDIRKLYPEHEKGKIIIATDEILDIYGKAMDLKRQEKAIKSQYSEIDTQIKLIMKDAERLVTPNLETLFTFKTNKKRIRTLLIKEI